MHARKKPKVFIGSSSENSREAKTVGSVLDYSCEPRYWQTGFTSSSIVIEQLISIITECDFAIFILKANDTIIVREEEFSAVRDNIIVEVGLSIGILGRERTFLITPRERDNLKLPSDFDGIVLTDYEKDRTKLSDALTAACTKIDEAISISRWNILQLILENAVWDGDKFPRKLAFKFTNQEAFGMTIIPKSFEVYDELPLQKDFVPPSANGKTYKPYFIEHMPTGSAAKYTEFHTTSRSITPNQMIAFWIPIDKSISVDILKKKIEERKCGLLDVKIVLHTIPTQTLNYVFLI